MKNTRMIKKNYEFKRFFSKGTVYRGKNICMYIHKNKFFVKIKILWYNICVVSFSLANKKKGTKKYATLQSV